MRRLLGLVCAALLLSSGQATAQQVVALGDSYSSGEGAPPFEAGTDVDDNSCHRSTRAWPLLVAQRLAVPARSFACSGAVIDELLYTDTRRRQPERRTAQVNRLQGLLGVKLVTLTIGGNDAGFAKVLAYCALHKRCHEHFQQPGPDNLADDIAALARRLPGVYDRVESRLPIGSRLVVVDYPRIFKRKPDFLSCTPLEPREMKYLNGQAAALDDAIRDAARSAGVQFVDVRDAFDGRELRCFGTRFVNHVGIGKFFPYSFHPNLGGQQALANAVMPAVRP